MYTDIDLDDYIDASELGLEEKTEEELEQERYNSETQMSLYGLSWRDFL